jgi:predicted MFS family arabinose efflux permease
VLEAAGLTIVAVAGSLPIALLGALVVGVGFSMLFPALALMVVGRVEEDRRGSALGAFTAFFDVGVGLGGPLAGATASLAGYPAVFFLAALAALGTAALAAMERTGSRRPRPAPD